MIYLLHSILALTAFLTVLNGFLRGTKKPQISAVLSIVLLALLGTAFLTFGWKTGALALALAFLYGAVSRPLAARLAARVFSMGDSNARHYPGLPPAQLGRISKELGRPSDTRRILEELIRDPDRSARAKAKLVDYCMSRPQLQALMREFGITPHALIEHYEQLAVAGAGQWAGGHYVAASALAYPHTLQFLLESKRAGIEPLEIACSLIMHFERGAPLARGCWTKWKPFGK